MNADTTAFLADPGVSVFIAALFWGVFLGSLLLLFRMGR